MSRNAKRSRVELRRSFLDRRSDRKEWEPHVGTRKSTRTAEQRLWRMEETRRTEGREEPLSGVPFWCWIPGSISPPSALSHATCTHGRDDAGYDSEEESCLVY